MKKIIVAHPEKQHSYRLGLALYKQKLLFKFITMGYYKKYNLTYWLNIFTKGKYKLDDIRYIKEIPEVMVKQFDEFAGIALLVLRRYKKGKIINIVQNFNFDIFGEKVAKYAKKNVVDAVIMYDTNSLKCFKSLEGTGIKRIMDTSIANRAYTKSIYEKVIKTKEDWDNFSEKDVLLNDNEMRRLKDEINLTDYFIVPSNFVKKSLIFSGVLQEKIHVVPYGVDTNSFVFSKRRANIIEEKLELLFVGECSYRKGINYILEAAYQLKDKVNLTIIGSYHRVENLYTQYKDCSSIKFLGRVPHNNLPQHYQKADVFVLPSLSEGMSLVGIEALASGLPLLCSENCGVNDLVEENINGWILSSIGVEALIEKIEYVLKNKTSIPQMGLKARETALNNNWDIYNDRMQKTIKQIIDLPE